VYVLAVLHHGGGLTTQRDVQIGRRLARELNDAVWKASCEIEGAMALVDPIAALRAAVEELEEQIARHDTRGPGAGDDPAQN
jgi:hypothetical protein